MILTTAELTATRRVHEGLGKNYAYRQGDNNIILFYKKNIQLQASVGIRKNR